MKREDVQVIEYFTGKFGVAYVRYQVIKTGEEKVQGLKTFDKMIKR